MQPTGGDRPDVVGAFEYVAHGIERDAAFRDVEIVIASAQRRGKTTELRVIVDREGGVDMQTCESIAHLINTALDAYDDLYTLQVESAGLDRPLVRPADYERFAGRNVKVVTTLSIANAKTHRGTLRGVRGTNVILEQPTGELPIPISVIKNANIEYDIRADLSRHKAERRRKP